MGDAAASAALSSPRHSEAMLLALARTALASETDAAEAAWPALDLGDPAQRAFGDYELLKELGRGGMGVVYRARQPSLDRDVAIKLIAAGKADGSNVARFLDEARAAARLLHPNIVPVHEFGTHDGVHYFSMPLIRGRSLGQLLEAGPLSSAAATALMLKLCDAMDYAHRLGLLHLDLKPTNILIDDRGEPLIADFGLARHVDAQGGVDAQEVSGTPSFMAPEQILIKQYRLTPATDTYALGAILYWCVTGASPHGQGNADELIRRAAAGRVRPPRDLCTSISRDLAAVCMKCMELQPSDRYAGVAEFADDLRRVRDGLPVSVRRMGLFERTGRWFRREPALASALALGLAAMGIGMAAALEQKRGADAARREALQQRDTAQRVERVAASERDRAEVATELGAFLYVRYDDTDSRDVGLRLIEWLGRRLPGDEQAQSEALSAFADHVDFFGRKRMHELSFSIVEALGSEYRAQVIAALAAGSDPNRHLYSAMLAWADETPPTASPAYRKFMDAALALQPDDLMTLQVAAALVPPGAAQSPYPEAARRLVELEPGNMFHWLLLHAAPDSTDPADALREAAKRTWFDDYVREGYATYRHAIATSGAKAPPLLAGPLRVLTPGGRSEDRIAKLHAQIIPETAWYRIDDYCNPANIPTAAARADCVAVGTMMARSPVGLRSRMIGAAVVRRLRPGTALAQEMYELRRDYVYTKERGWKLTRAQRAAASQITWFEDERLFGELAATQRYLERLGIPGKPPPGWMPDDRDDLLLPEDRAARP